MNNIILRGNPCLNKYSIFTSISKIIVFIVVLFGTQAFAQTPKPKRTLTVTVVSATTGEPLEGARVRSGGQTKINLTDKDGNFIFENGQEHKSITVYLEGYDDKNISFSQNSSKLKITLHPINDPFRDINPKFEALKIGEKVPDIQFAIKNYHTPTAKISDFSGKLLIFDFWTTSCAVCIYSFPKMEALQKKYGDKVQVILVNVRETEDQIKTRLAYRKTPISQLETMPLIVSNLAMTQLFPHHFAGNYFWIDPEGILRLASALYFNHHDQKINDVINGKEITFIDQGIHKSNKSLAQLIHDSPDLYTELGSTFTTAHKDYIYAGGKKLGIIDSASKTIRNTYINITPLMFYYTAFEEFIKKEWETRVYGPNRGTRNYLDAFEMKITDSSLYDYRFIPFKDETDINSLQSMFCYEQILSINTDKKQANTILLEDLNRYFGLKYGTEISIEEKSVPGYIIKRISEDPVTENKLRKKLKHLGKRTFQNIGDFESAIDNFYRPDPSKNVEPWFPYVFDVNGENRKREIIMPVWKEGDKLEDFILALSANGLDYIKGEQKIKKIVIRDNQ